MKRQSNDNANSINSNSNIRLPIGVVLTFIISVSGFAYTRYDANTSKSEQQINSLREYIDKKSALRFTQTEAAQLEKSIEQRFNDMEKRNNQQHTNFQRQIDRIASNNRNN